MNLLPWLFVALVNLGLWAFVASNDGQYGAAGGFLVAIFIGLALWCILEMLLYVVGWVDVRRRHRDYRKAHYMDAVFSREEREKFAQQEEEYTEEEREWWK